MTKGAPINTPENLLQAHRAFCVFNLVGSSAGVLSIFVRESKDKHYTLYDRAWFTSARSAIDYARVEWPGIPVFVARPVFE